MTIDRRTTLGLMGGGLALSVFGAGPVQAAPTFPGEAKVTMDLFQGDKVIGQHAYEIIGSQAAPEVRTLAGFQGRILGFRVKYELSTVEKWQGGQLSQLRSKGELRGQPFEISAERQDDRLMVVNDRGRTVKADPGLLPTTYWMPNFVQQRQVLVAVVHDEELDVPPFDAVVVAVRALVGPSKPELCAVADQLW